MAGVPRTLLGCFIQIVALSALGGALQLTSERADFTKNEGGVLRLECNVTGSDFNMFFNAIIWTKVLADGQQVQINTAAIVSEPFVDTGRYVIAPGQDVTSGGSPGIQMTLVISDISLADNGTYACELHGRTGVIDSVTYNLLVSAVIESLTLETNSSVATSTAPAVPVFRFTLGEPAWLSCRSVGGNPRPTLTVSRGAEDITHMFAQRARNTTSGPRGLQVVKYDIELVTDSFVAAAAHNGDHVICVSHIHHSAQHRTTVRALIDVPYPPQFDCSQHASAILSTQQYELQCHVDSNPSVDLASITWSIGGGPNGTNLTVGETRNGYTASATVDGSRVTVILTIAEVNDSDYRIYNLTASNALGQTDYQITLSPVTTTVAPPSTSATIPTTTKHPDGVTPRAANVYPYSAGTRVRGGDVIAYVIALAVGRLVVGRGR